MRQQIWIKKPQHTELKTLASLEGRRLEDVASEAIALGLETYLERKGIKLPVAS